MAELHWKHDEVRKAINNVYTIKQDFNLALERMSLSDKESDRLMELGEQLKEISNRMHGVIVSANQRYQYDQSVKKSQGMWGHNKYA